MNDSPNPGSEADSTPSRRSLPLKRPRRAAGQQPEPPARPRRQQQTPLAAPHESTREADPALEQLFSQASGAVWSPDASSAPALLPADTGGSQEEAPLLDEVPAPEHEPSVPRAPRKPPWARRRLPLGLALVLAVLLVTVVLLLPRLVGETQLQPGAERVIPPPPLIEQATAPPARPTAASPGAPAASEAQPPAAGPLQQLADDPELVRDPRFHQPSARPLLERLALEHPGWSVRLHAVRGLGRIADPASLTTLATVLRQDSDWTVRAEAADALSRIPGATGPLESSSQDDPEWVVRQAAKAALEPAGSP